MLRALYKSDLTELLVIEKAVHVVPWTEETFNICFQSGYTGYVAEVESGIIGFIILSQTPTECHVLNLCVAHTHQHQGWGRKLLERALAEAKTAGVSIAYLEVRRSNANAISLYRQLAFHLIGERKNYYPTLNGTEDALVFAKSLHETTT